MDSDHESEDDLVIDDAENNDAPAEDGFEHGEGDADDNERVLASQDPLAAGGSHQPLRLQPNVLDCRAFDIIPYVLAVHPCNIYCLAATQCMRWVFTGSEDGYVRKYDFFASMNGKTPLTQGQRHGQVDSVTKAGILTSYWENEEQPIRVQPAFGLDGASVVSGGAGSGQMDVDMPAIKREESIEPGVAAASSSSGIASASTFQRAPSPEESKMSAVYSLDCHSEAIFAISGLESGSINLWTPRHEEGTCHHVFRKHTAPVSCLKLTPDQRGFISGSWDHSILQWDLENGAIVREYTGHGSQISSLSFQPNGMPTMDMDFSDPMVNQANDSVLMSTSVDGMICFWDRRDPTPIPRKLLPPERVPPWALSACWNADVDEWNFAEGRHIQTIKMPANSGPVSYVKCLPNNKHLICASQDNIRMWNVTELDTKSSLRPFQILAGHHGGLISAIHIDPTCKYMVTTSGNREWEGPSTNACLFYDIQTLPSRCLQLPKAYAQACHTAGTAGRYALIVLNQPILLERSLFENAWNNDGGANRLYDLLQTEEQRAKFLPDCIRGDLDSLRSGVEEYYKSKGVKIERVDDQVSTDFMKCVELVRDLDSKDSEPGAHTISCNLEIEGPTCGIIPVGTSESILNTKGLQWDVENWRTSFGTNISTSNALRESCVVIDTTKPMVWTTELRRRS
ncbi:Transcription factor spt8 [Actinomortierella ambigua]|nr:Transcription factor spt8 [Actinomortierella ambigua]